MATRKTSRSHARVGARKAASSRSRTSKAASSRRSSTRRASSQASKSRRSTARRGAESRFGEEDTLLGGRRAKESERGFGAERGNFGEDIDEGSPRRRGLGARSSESRGSEGRWGREEGRGGQRIASSRSNESRRGSSYWAGREDQGYGRGRLTRNSSQKKRYYR